MNILNPDNVNHELIIIPRFYPEGSVLLELKSEGFGETITHTLTAFIEDGYMYLSFEQDFNNNSRYSVKITKGGDVVYRGKIFVTDQAADTQNYKISKGVFQ